MKKVSYKDMIKKMKIWEEKTSTSCNGILLGHYTIYIICPIRQITSCRRETRNQSDTTSSHPCYFNHKNYGKNINIHLTGIN